MISEHELAEKRSRIRELKAKVEARRPIETAPASEPQFSDMAMSSNSGVSPANSQAPAQAQIPSQMAMFASGLILAPLNEKDHPGEPVIPGTNYTETGVKRLLALLKQRSETPGAVARIVAGWLLAFLTRPPQRGQLMVAGANLDQLKQITDLLERQQTQGLVGNLASPAGSLGTPQASVGTPQLSIVSDPSLQRLDEMEQSINRLESAIETIALRLQQTGEVAEAVVDDSQPTI